MSTTLSVECDPPADVAAVLASLERPGLDWADGDLATLRGPWPHGPHLFYVRDRSSRGVEVSCEAARFQVRLLALSSEADYDLALRFIEVVGGDREVEVEGEERVPARDVRERLTEWIARDQAAGIAAARAALEAGQSVAFDGPVHRVELSLALLEQPQVDLIELARRAQASAPSQADLEDPSQARFEGELVQGVEEHLSRRKAEEDTLAAAKPPGSGPPRQRRSTVAVLLVGALVIVPALVVRLLVWPMRERLLARAKSRREAAAERRCREARDRMAAESEHLAAAPDDVDARQRRALAALDLGHTAWAERELDACVARLDAGATAETPLWAVLNNLAVARRRLRLPQLAAQAEERVIALGQRPAYEASARSFLGFAAFLFLLISGLSPD